MDREAAVLYAIYVMFLSVWTSFLNRAEPEGSTKQELCVGIDGAVCQSLSARPELCLRASLVVMETQSTPVDAGLKF